MKVLFWVGVLASCGMLVYEPHSRLAMVGLGFMIGVIVAPKR